MGFLKELIRRAMKRGALRMGITKEKIQTDLLGHQSRSHALNLRALQVGNP
jgi:hypothetical protein